MTAEQRVREAFRALADTSAGQPAPTAVAARPQQPVLRVLLVCGEPLLRSALVDCLATAPVATAVTWTDDLSVATADHSDIDVVLAVEHRLPRLARLVGAVACPILVVTHADSPEDVDAVVELGVAGVVGLDASAQTVVDALLAVRHGLRLRVAVGPAPPAVLCLDHSPVETDGDDLDLGSVAMAASDLPLTAREREIVQMIVDGFSVKQIASRLGIALQTAKNHVHHAMGKVGASTRLQLYQWAREHGFDHTRAEASADASRNRLAPGTGPE